MKTHKSEADGPSDSGYTHLKYLLYMISLDLCYKCHTIGGIFLPCFFLFLYSMNNFKLYALNFQRLGGKQIGNELLNVLREVRAGCCSSIRSKRLSGHQRHLQQQCLR